MGRRTRPIPEVEPNLRRVGIDQHGARRRAPPPTRKGKTMKRATKQEIDALWEKLQRVQILQEPKGLTPSTYRRLHRLEMALSEKFLSLNI